MMAASASPRSPKVLMPPSTTVPRGNSSSASTTTAFTVPICSTAS